jgi:hypothetical protein
MKVLFKGAVEVKEGKLPGEIRKKDLVDLLVLAERMKLSDFLFSEDELRELVRRVF